MFDNEIRINNFQLGLFQKIIVGIDDAGLYKPGAGHGHSAAWILGHLAITAELGQSMLGGKISHPDWLPHFAPGSSGVCDAAIGISKLTFTDAIIQGYQNLQSMAASANADAISKPHQIALFDGTPIETIEHAVALLLTNHFGFHLAQLSSVRRENGGKFIF
jgi:hypothetical protein